MKSFSWKKIEKIIIFGTSTRTKIKVWIMTLYNKRDKEKKESTRVFFHFEDQVLRTLQKRVNENTFQHVACLRARRRKCLR